MEAKEISNGTHWFDTFNLGEPASCFTVAIPKEAKRLKHIAGKTGSAFDYICVQTDDKGHSHLIATDSRILTVFILPQRGGVRGGLLPATERMH